MRVEATSSDLKKSVRDGKEKRRGTERIRDRERRDIESGGK